MELEQRMISIETKVDEIKEGVNFNRQENAVLKGKVMQHEHRIMNGDWADLVAKVTTLSDNFIKLKASIEGGKSKWKDIAMSLGVLSTVLGMLYIITQIWRIL